MNPEIIHTFELPEGDFHILDSTQVGDRIQLDEFYFDIPDRETLRKLKNGEWCCEIKREGGALEDPRDELIAQALSRLDPDNDEHWTDKGLPDLQAVAKFAGRYIKREELPDFRR